MLLVSKYRGEVEGSLCEQREGKVCAWRTAQGGSLLASNLETRGRTLPMREEAPDFFIATQIGQVGQVRQVGKIPQGAKLCPQGICTPQINICTKVHLCYWVA